MNFTFSKTKPKRRLDALLLPDSEKRRMAESLLEEFGAGHIHVRDDEMIHGCLLPWASHTDQVRNPTASLNWRKLVYSCLGCGSGGGLLWFIASMRNQTTDEARTWVEQDTGTGKDVSDIAQLVRFVDSCYADRPARHPIIPSYDDRVLTPWLKIHPWMTEIRGCHTEVLMANRVGYAPDYKVGNKTSERIVLPHFWQGKLVGWQTRRLTDDGTAKYLSSPDFPKDHTLYNYDPHRASSVIVESVLSVLNKGHVIPDIVATFGAKVTQRQVRLLSALPSVVLWMDNDTAGWKATEEIGGALIGFSIVWVVNSPWAGDMADLDDDEALRLLASPVPYSEWRRPSTLKQWKG